MQRFIYAPFCVYINCPETSTGKCKVLQNKVSVLVNGLCVSRLCVLGLRVKGEKKDIKFVPCKWYSEAKYQVYC